MVHILCDLTQMQSDLVHATQAFKESMFSLLCCWSEEVCKYILVPYLKFSHMRDLVMFRNICTFSLHVTYLLTQLSF